MKWCEWRQLLDRAENTVCDACGVRELEPAVHHPVSDHGNSGRVAKPIKDCSHAVRVRGCIAPGLTDPLQNPRFDDRFTVEINHLEFD